MIWIYHTQIPVLVFSITVETEDSGTPLDNKLFLLQFCINSLSLEIQSQGAVPFQSYFFLNDLHHLKKREVTIKISFLEHNKGFHTSQ